MLAIRYQSYFSIKKVLLLLAVVAVIAAGVYVTALFMSPALAHKFFIKPLTVSSLPAPSVDDNRLVVPKLGINISYATDSAQLVQNSQWRKADLGNPEDGGTMILVAHKLSLQITPQQTVARSPFYTLDTLRSGDKLIVDYQGVRYGYEVSGIRSGKTSDATIPTDTSTDQLVLYTYDSDDDTSRTVVIAKPLGKVALQ